MAVFTAIASALVSATGLLTAGTFAFNLAVGVVATGLATATAKLFGIFDAPRATDDPGVKIQLPPATDNKIPRLYGRNFTGGIITDAEIRDGNKRMTYCLVLSEYTPGDVWTVNAVYRDDKKLVFSGGDYLDSVGSTIDANQTSAQSWRNTFRVRIYAGNAYAQAQVFPSAQSDDARNLFTNWTINNSMEGLVFALVEVLYNDNQGVFGLGSFTFDITNSISEPSNVLLDYLQNTRYGPGITNLDLSSFAEWAAVCNQSVNHYNSANVFTSRPRYRINGALSMFDTVKQNINKICQNGGAFFTHNTKTGEYGVVPLRAATSGEKANAWTFDNKNIISKCQITSTELFSLYNEMEVEYPSVAQRDQTATVYVSTPGAQRHPNEPDNKLNFKLMMTNSRSQAYNLANIDLRQSRLSTIVQFTADYSTLQCDVGDVVKVDLAEYGWEDKLFRIMRLREIEDSDGALSVEVTLLEYADSVYDHTIEADDLDISTTGTGITDRFHVPYMTNGGFGYTNISNIWVINDPDSNVANKINPATGTVQALTPLDLIYPLSPYGVNPQTIFELNMPGEGTYDTAILITEGPLGNIRTTVTSPPGLFFEANSKVYIAQDTFSFDSSNNKFLVSLFNSQTGVTSNVITVDNVLIDMSNAIPSAKIKNLAVTTAKIADLAVNTAKIDNLAVNTGKIANLAVNTLQIGNQAVTIPVTITNVTPITMVAATGTWPQMGSWSSLLTTTYRLESTGSAGLDQNIPVMITWSVEADAQTADPGARYFRLIRTGVPPSQEGDPNYGSVDLLLPMTGSAGSTTFLDYSPAPRSTSVVGSLVISTAQSKWGQGSGRFPGTGSYLTIPYSQDFNWWEQDFTIEAWVWVADLSSTSYNDGGFIIPTLLGHGSVSGSTNYWSFGPIENGKIRFYYVDSTLNKNFGGESLGSMTAQSWNHIAFTKTSAGVRVWLNGQGTSNATINGTPLSNVSFPLVVGQINNRGINAYVNDLRITRGIARYTSNFTPPVTAFPLTGQNLVDGEWSNTTLVAHFDGYDGQNTNIPDYSAGGNAIIFAGNAQLASNHQLFGTTSLYLPGTNNSYVRPNTSNTRFDLGNVSATSKYTWEFSLRSANTFNTVKTIMSHAIPDSAGSGCGGWKIWLYQGNLYFTASKTNNNVIPRLVTYKTNTTPILANTWSQCALVMNNGDFKWYVNGQQQTSQYLVPFNSYSNSLIGFDTTRTDYGLIIGAASTDNVYTDYNEVYSGHMDEIRLTQGVARYTSNYSPASSPFGDDPQDANTSVLYVSFEGSRDTDQFCSGVYLDSIQTNVTYTYALEGCGRTSDDQVHQRAMWITAARR